MARVQVNYKSGAFMVTEVDEFTVTRNQTTGNLSAEWENAKPRPLLLGLDDVESIWELT